MNYILRHRSQFMEAAVTGRVVGKESRINAKRYQTMETLRCRVV